MLKLLSKVITVATGLLVDLHIKFDNLFVGCL